MHGYIGHTDRAWWRFQSDQGDSDEVNFWRSDRRQFSALQPGEPFFFRLKAPVNRIAGFGAFARAATLPLWRAWEVFGEANGVRTEGDLLALLSSAARREVQGSDEIGCIAVTDCVLFSEDEFLAVPGSFKTENLSGSRIDLSEGEGSELWAACLKRGAGEPPAATGRQAAAPARRYGREQLMLPRLGQGSFRLAVMEAYGGRCSITGERSAPALEAAHIRPWAQGGAHEVSNGLLLRRDLHRLFDLGYLSATIDEGLLVSPQLGAESGYAQLAGQPLAQPVEPDGAPSPEALAWHLQSVFRAD
jgi:putative restriction endonuclease